MYVYLHEYNVCKHNHLSFSIRMYYVHCIIILTTCLSIIIIITQQHLAYTCCIMFGYETLGVGIIWHSLASHGIHVVLLGCAAPESYITIWLQNCHAWLGPQKPTYMHDCIMYTPLYCDNEAKLLRNCNGLLKHHCSHKVHWMLQNCIRFPDLE
jgi:hypothetical protein